jgi:hypothetical protein
MQPIIPLGQMTKAEKIRALEKIWDDLGQEPDAIPSPSWHADVLAAREGRLWAGGSHFVDWAEAKRNIRDVPEAKPFPSENNRLREVSPSLETSHMPEISRFFGLIVRMYYNEHEPPHMHAEYQGNKALVDFEGNVLKGRLGSRTALRLLRQWIELHAEELEEDWRLARNGQETRKIDPLD